MATHSGASREKDRVRFNERYADPVFRKYKLQCQRRERRQRRLNAIRIYGGKCECCGESIPEFLTFDHPDGRTGPRIVREAVQAIVDAGCRIPGYRLYCFNCNCGRELNGGECPHVTRHKD